MGDTFFSDTFGGSGSATMPGGQFSSLYNGVVTAFGGVYGLIIRILILVIFIMSGVVIIRAFTKDDKRQQQEEKDKLANNAIVLVLAVSLSGIIAFIYTIFKW